MDNTIIDEAYVNNDLGLTPKSKKLLLSISRFGITISIIVLLFSVVLLFSSVNMINNYYSDEDFNIALEYSNVVLISGIKYSFIAIALMIASKFIISFSLNAKKSVVYSDIEKFEQALLNLKSLFILTFLVPVVLFVITIIQNLKDLLMYFF